MPKNWYRSKAAFVSLILLVQMLMMNGSVSQVICRDSVGVRLEKADILSHCHCHNHPCSLVSDHDDSDSLPSENTRSLTEWTPECRDLAIDDFMLSGQKHLAAGPVNLPLQHPPVCGIPAMTVPSTAFARSRIGESPPGHGPSLFLSFSVWRC